MTGTLDLSSVLLPPLSYFPFPTLVPWRLSISASDWVSLADLRRLAACTDEGPDTVLVGRVERTPELSVDPGTEVQAIVERGLTVQRWTFHAERAGHSDNASRLAAWSAHVTGLTFHADDQGRVYVDGPDGRIILHDRADKRWNGLFQPTVWADEEDGPGGQIGPALLPSGHSKRWPCFAALVEARNEDRAKRSHGRVPDAVKSLLAMTPMIGSDRKPTTVVEVEERTEPNGLMTRRAGQRYTLRLNDATMQRFYGERAGSPQSVLLFDTADTVEATDTSLGHGALQLLRCFDTEYMITVIGALMKAYDTRNRAQRIGSHDLAELRGRTLTSAKDRKYFNAMSELLSNVIIEVTPVKSDGTKARLQLFARQGEVVAPGGKQMPLVTLNEPLYRAMLETGHGILMDRRMLTADLRTHEWAARVYAAISIQWSLGWVVNGYATGNRLRRSAKVVLAESGIAYDFAAERRKRGAGVVRQKLAGTFDRMVKLGWLKDWTLVREASDPADDMYEFNPPDALTTALTSHRTALAHDRRTGRRAKGKR